MKLFILFMLFPFSYLRAETIFCSIFPNCNLASSVFEGVQATAILPTNIDFHHYRIRSNEIKQLISKKFLLIGPSELEPWSKNFDKMKAFPSQINLSKLISETNKKFAEHYWLRPNLLCNIGEKLKQLPELSSLKVKSGFCQKSQIEKVWKKIQMVGKDFLFIVNHDSLTPIFNSYNLKSIALQTGDHHHQVSSQQLLLLTKLLQGYQPGKVVWIEEQGVQLGHFQYNKYRHKEHRVLKVNTKGSPGESIWTPITQISQQILQILAPTSS